MTIDTVQLSIGELLLRVSLAFFVLLILTRIMGRKQVSQLTFFDYVTGISIGSIAAILAIDLSVPIFHGIIALVAWVAWLMVLNVVTLKSVPARKIINGVPIMVVYDGKILEKNLGSRYYTVNDLLMELRENGVFDLQEVQVAIAEPDGELSIMKKPQYQPVTAKALNLAVNDAPLASRFAGKELIINGEIMKDNVSQFGIDELWVKQQLQKQGVSDIKQVNLAAITPQGTFYVDKNDDLK